MESKRIIADSDLHEAFRIRKEVFVTEQKVPLTDEFDEFDTLDGRCDHILAYFNRQAAGTGRIRIVNDSGKLERICILQPYRKYGLGKIIVKALEEIAAEKGLARVKLHGQTHAAGFYKKLGYQTASEVFMEDGIAHIVMTKELPAQ